MRKLVEETNLHVASLMEASEEAQTLIDQIKQQRELKQIAAEKIRSLQKAIKGPYGTVGSRKNERERLKMAKDHYKNAIEKLKELNQKLFALGDKERASDPAKDDLAKHQKEFPSQAPSNPAPKKPSLDQMRAARERAMAKRDSFELQALRLKRSGQDERAARATAKANEFAKVAKAHNDEIKKAKAKAPSAKTANVDKKVSMMKSRSTNARADRAAAQGRTKRADALRKQADKHAGVARSVKKAVATKKTGQSWWDNMSPEDRKAYIKAHPNSKMSKK